MVFVFWKEAVVLSTSEVSDTVVTVVSAVVVVVSGFEVVVVSGFVLASVVVVVVVTDVSDELSGFEMSEPESLFPQAQRDIAAASRSDIIASFIFIPFSSLKYNLSNIV